MDVTKAQIPRRVFMLQTLSFVPAAYVGLESIAQADPAATYTPSFFTTAEWRFLNAFVDRLIPADDVGPGALDAAVPVFIDLQMNTNYGHGGSWFMQGPFVSAAPEFGYQLNLTPRDIYRQGIAAADHAITSAYGKSLPDMDAPTRDEVLKKLEAGTLDIGTAPPAKTLFAAILQNTHEGYFADPAYGGNKDMAAWDMIGFPGARGDYLNWVDQYGKKYPYAPTSIVGEGT
jgi:gluconate 2-dehydrogenase gamma chain